MSKPVGEAPKVNDTDQPEPWAPEGASRVGRFGERGTSAHEAGLTASDERGPARGVDYYEGRPLDTGGTDHVRESASKG